MEDLATKFIGAIAAGIAAVVWLVRLEAVAISNRREIKRLWDQRKEDMQQAKDARQETAAILTEIRADIKLLLTGGRK